MSTLQVVVVVVVFVVIVSLAMVIPFYDPSRDKRGRPW